MTGVSKTILIGHLGADPEIRDLQNGDRVASFRLATSENWTDKATGEKKERTEWHSVVVFNKPLVEIVAQYLKKGSKVYVEGQNRTRKYTDKAGVEKYTTEVVLAAFRGEIQLLDRAESNHPPPAGSIEDYGSASGRADPAKSAASAMIRGDAPARPAIDDEIPF